jgi:hypothetical protein
MGLCEIDKCCCGPDALPCEVTSRAVCVDGALGAELLLVLASLHLSCADAFTFLSFLEADCLGVSVAGGLQCLFEGRMLSILVGCYQYSSIFSIKNFRLSFSIKFFKRWK